MMKLFLLLKSLLVMTIMGNISHVVVNTYFMHITFFLTHQTIVKKSLLKSGSNFGSQAFLDTKNLLVYKDPNYMRTSAPKKTFCPSGMLGAPLTHDRIWQKPFISLGVTNHALQDEIYLAAFLSCWLCKFVLPIGTPNLIRPSTFKIASMMSVGEGFCSAVPVLSKIYNGLHEISTATDLKKCNACFPAHYLYSWIAAKYDTHFIENEKCGSLAGMANYGGVRMARYYNPT